MSDGRCSFCLIVSRAIPASVVHEDDVTIAFLDIAPITPGHTLVVPRVHARSLGELAPDAGGAMLRTAMRVAAGLRSTELRVEGVNLLLSDGLAAGQEVPHVHLHVVPRFAGDGLQIRAAHGHPSREELEATAEAIRTGLAQAG